MGGGGGGDSAHVLLITLKLWLRKFWTSLFLFFLMCSWNRYNQLFRLLFRVKQVQTALQRCWALEGRDRFFFNFYYDLWNCCKKILEIRFFIIKYCDVFLDAERTIRCQCSLVSGFSGGRCAFFWIISNSIFRFFIFYFFLNYINQKYWLCFFYNSFEGTFCFLKLFIKFSQVVIAPR